MIGLSHIYGRLAPSFGAVLVPIALVCAPAYADGHPGASAWLRCEP